MTAAAFGDSVRIKNTTATRKLGLSGLRGVVYGETVPSKTNVDVIGPSDGDFALNVHVADRNENFWFAPELVELIDHAAGTEITLDGVPKKWVRRSDGGWDEFAPAKKRAWWRLWG